MIYALLALIPLSQSDVDVRELFRRIDALRDKPNAKIDWNAPLIRGTIPDVDEPGPARPWMHLVSRFSITLPNVAELKLSTANRWTVFHAYDGVSEEPNHPPHSLESLRARALAYIKLFDNRDAEIFWGSLHLDDLNLHMGFRFIAPTGIGPTVMNSVTLNPYDGQLRSLVILPEPQPDPDRSVTITEDRARQIARDAVAANGAIVNWMPITEGESQLGDALPNPVYDVYAANRYRDRCVSGVALRSWCIRFHVREPYQNDISSGYVEIYVHARDGVIVFDGLPDNKSQIYGPTTLSRAPFGWDMPSGPIEIASAKQKIAIPKGKVVPTDAVPSGPGTAALVSFWVGKKRLLVPAEWHPRSKVLVSRVGSRVSVGKLH